MFVSVGSRSNHDDADTHPAEKNRADILEFNPDGSGMRIYAYGIRNAVGITVNPTTGELWASVNERDDLGNNLVPDYITHVQEGGFYGWPWFYMGHHQDPSLAGQHPELKEQSHHSRCARAAAFRVTANAVLRGQAIPERNMTATLSPPNTARGIAINALAMK